MIHYGNKGFITMKIRHIRFSIFTSLLIFFITFPVLSQSRSYRATVSRFGGGQIGQVIQAGTPNDLANRLYTVIRSSSEPLPKINISLGTVSLSTFSNTVQAKDISTVYYEFIGGGSKLSKSPWDLVNVSSIRSSIKTYGVLLSKKSYFMTTQIPFRVQGMKNGVPILKFDRLSTTLVDGTIIDYTLDTGNSGINSKWLNQNLESRDSRLRSTVRSAFEFEMIEPCSRHPAQQGGGGCSSPKPKPKYSIQLSRN
jgi:hypothetical protein